MAVLLMASIYFWTRVHVRMESTNSRLWGSGLCSGVLNGWSGLSGPPIVIYYLMTGITPDAIRGTLAGFFLLLYSFTAIGSMLSGDYDGFSQWGLLVSGMIAILALYRLAGWFVERSRFDFQKLALAFIGFASISVIVRNFLEQVERSRTRMSPNDTKLAIVDPYRELRSEAQ